MVEIKLRRRYVKGADYKNQKSSHANSGNQKRKKLDSRGKQALSVVPQMVMQVNANTGQQRMIWTGKMLQHTGTVLKEV